MNNEKCKKYREIYKIYEHREVDNNFDTIEYNCGCFDLCRYGCTCCSNINDINKKCTTTCRGYCNNHLPNDGNPCIHRMI